MLLGKTSPNAPAVGPQCLNVFEWDQSILMSSLCSGICLHCVIGCEWVNVTFSVKTFVIRKKDIQIYESFLTKDKFIYLSWDTMVALSTLFKHLFIYFKST